MRTEINVMTGEVTELPDVPGAQVILTIQQQRDAIQTQIEALERTQLLPRITRESLLLIMVSTAAGMGLTEPQLYAVNIGYSRLKDFDAAIVALRAQMEAIV